jgi:D-alanine-D-alanine ligase
MSAASPLRIAIVMGGPSDEHPISLKTGSAVLEALGEIGHHGIPIPIGTGGHWHLDGDLNARGTLPGAAMAALEKLAPDVVFNALHGPFGEDGTIQALLETLALPYTGSGVAPSALAMDKVRAKKVVQAAGVSVAPDVAVTRDTWSSERAETLENIQRVLRLPLFVKPVRAGSSFGASPVESSDELGPAIDRALEADTTALVEPLLQGMEVTAGILGDSEGRRLEALPLVSIEPVGHRFFDFESKYTPGHNIELCPAPVPEDVTRAVQNDAIGAHRALGAFGMSRSDFILTSEGPVWLELNSLPGLTPESLIPRACAEFGLSFHALVERLISQALARSTT